MFNVPQWYRHHTPDYIRNYAGKKIFASACRQDYATIAITEISTLTFLGSTDT